MQVYLIGSHQEKCLQYCTVIPSNLILLFRGYWKKSISHYLIKKCLNQLYFKTIKTNLKNKIKPSYETKQLWNVSYYELQGKYHYWQCNQWEGLSSNCCPPYFYLFNVFMYQHSEKNIMILLDEKVHMKLRVVNSFL